MQYADKEPPILEPCLRSCPPSCSKEVITYHFLTSLPVSLISIDSALQLLPK